MFSNLMAKNKALKVSTSNASLIIYYSAVFSALASSTGASTAGASSFTGSSANSSLIVISLFSILAPTCSLVLAALPTLSLK